MADDAKPTATDDEKRNALKALIKESIAEHEADKEKRRTEEKSKSTSIFDFFK